MDDKYSEPKDSDHIEASFVPTTLKMQMSADPQWKIGDELTKDKGTLLWIDICNFSPLCNRLMKDTSKGVEKIYKRTKLDFCKDIC